MLVPRSPIAELIEQRFAPWLPAEPARILDLCTGSGCIGIACTYAFEQAEVVLADLSFDALEVANVNIERHDLGERVYTVQGDGFAGLPGQRFDLIVSNPPYVDAEDFADMPAEFHHEPELGLACGDDGLDLVRRMLAEAADHLSEKGLLIVEVGNSRSMCRRCIRKWTSPGWSSSTAATGCSCCPPRSAASTGNCSVRAWKSDRRRLVPPVQ